MGREEQSSVAKPLDRIVIRDLLLRCVIGIQDWERNTRQDVVVNVTLFADITTAGRSDRIEDTVNYKTLAKRMIAFTEASSFYLVEALAEKLAEMCLEEPGVERVRIGVEKPGALRFARSVGVEIERGRG
ncbi:MAG: dihydroneopterin aldolase [Magnetococcales bacterium]|nr:dihydroneopterin aldolase [Magnetococcales bacterium]